MLSSALPQASCRRFAVQQPSQLCRTRPVLVPTATSSPLSTSALDVRAVTTLQPQQAPAGLQTKQQQIRQASPINRPGPPEEDYTSSPAQQAIVVGAALLFAALELRGLSQVSSPLAALQCALAAFAGYIIAGESGYQ